MIGFIIGMIFGSVATYLVLSKKIFSPDVSVQFEVGELESTDTMSKIEVISCVTNMSNHNTEKEKKEFFELVNNTWLKSDDIQWITTIASQRNDKIDQILNS